MEIAAGVSDNIIIITPGLVQPGSDPEGEH